MRPSVWIAVSVLAATVCCGLSGCKSLRSEVEPQVVNADDLGSPPPLEVRPDKAPEPTVVSPETVHPAMTQRQAERSQMVERQIASRDITSERVLEAMRRVPRHVLIPPEGRAYAYEDHPVSIGHRQTISQPYIVAYMTEALAPKAHHRVLEIGTGSGYQAAVLAELVAEVYTIEIVEVLGRRARAALDDLGYDNIRYRIGDGYAGWAEHAPFDAVILTAAPPQIPKPLLEQLKVGGVMIAPVGTMSQELVRITRTQDGYQRERVMGVRFVPMTGRAQSGE